jgi:transcriptional regulator with XRE-family HTH domain
MRFGEMLSREREKAGMSQPQLAEAAGVPVASLRNWEQGRRSPRAPAVLRLAKALGVPPDELMLALAREWLDAGLKKHRRKK